MALELWLLLFHLMAPESGVPPRSTPCSSMSRHLPWIRSPPQPSRSRKAEIQWSLNSTALELWRVPPDTTCQRSLQCIALHLHRSMRQNDSSEQHRKRSHPSSILQWVLALDQELALVKALELEPEPAPERSCLELEQGLVLEPACS